MQENLYPFSPLVCRDTISDGFHEFLMDGLDETYNGNSYNAKLAGNIQNQKGAVYDIDLFYDYLNPYVQEYFQEYHRSYSFIKLNDSEWMQTLQYKQRKLNYVTYDFGDLGPWVNFMNPNEYNPIHRHSGDLSAIIFIDIPKQIEEERLYNRENGLPNSNSGLVDFWCNDRNWLVSPKSKQIMLFPSSLLHGVYPFSSDVKRVTMSFNLHNVGKHYE